MSYAASISAEGSLSQTLQSSTNTGPQYTITPVVWRRLVHFFCPHLNSTDDNIEESSPDAFLETAQAQVQEEEKFMSGAMPNNQVCQHDLSRQPCMTGSCSKQPQRGPKVIALPSPTGPDSTSRVNTGRASIFSISSKINAFTKDIDLRFLSTEGQQVLHSLQELSDTSEGASNVLVQLGNDAFWMTPKDAHALETIDRVVGGLSVLEKERLFKDLHQLLSPQQRYPLEQVLSYGAQVRSRDSGDGDSDDVDNVIDLYGYRDDATRKLQDEIMELLSPRPLRIRKKAEIELRQLQRRGPLSKANEVKATPDATATNGAATVIPDIEDCKQPGIIAQTHAGPSRAQRGSQTPSTNTMTLSHPKLRIDSENGSVKRARDNLFANPRPAPSPPFAKEQPASQHEADQSPKQPGSVGRARGALRKSLGGPSAVEDDELRQGKPETLEEMVKRPGSIRQALDDLYSKTGYAPQLTTKVARLPPSERAVSETSSANERPRSFGAAKAESSVRKSTASESTMDHPSPEPSLHTERSIDSTGSSQETLVTRHISLSDPNDAGLRGGGGDGHTNKTAMQSNAKGKSLIRHLSMLFKKATPLPVDERPPAAIWWLAGGRVGNHRQVPTVEELKVRKQVEEANRNVVGYWGTVIGVRAIRRMSVAKIGEEEDGMDGCDDKTQLVAEDDEAGKREAEQEAAED